jgi:hypothetical protein
MKKLKIDILKEDLTQEMFGGRTNAFVLYYKVKLNERIKYVDFCRLYLKISEFSIFLALFLKIKK